jgi:hypothetical protein
MAFPPGFSMPVGDIARPRAGRWRHRGGGASQGVETQRFSVPGSYLLVNIYIYNSTVVVDIQVNRVLKLKTTGGAPACIFNGCWMGC